MSGYLVKHLIENYQGIGIFILNDNEVKDGFDRGGVDIQNEE